MFTLDDKTPKMRIADAVLFNKSKVTLLTSVYQSVLPIFKMYVMLLQSVPVLLRKARRPGKVYNFEKNCEIEIGLPN